MRTCVIPLPVLVNVPDPFTSKSDLSLVESDTCLFFHLPDKRLVRSVDAIIRSQMEPPNIVLTSLMSAIKL
jgi:hypothetical protein